MAMADDQYFFALVTIYFVMIFFVAA